MTRYTVLRATDAPNTYTVITDEAGEPIPFTGANDIHALRVAAKETGLVMDGAVAIPLRNFRPRKREVETTTRELWT